MTTPTPITPPSLQDLEATRIAAGVQTLLDNAKRLGLTWQLILGTIVDGSNTSRMTLTIDGDTQTQLAAVSMIGELAIGQRVYLIQVPPSGLFVAGVVGSNLNDVPFYAARQTLTSTTASVTFTLPTTLRSFHILYSARSDAAINVLVPYLRINGDSSANYHYQYQQVSNTTFTGIAAQSQTQANVGLLTGSPPGARFFGSGEIVVTGWDTYATRNVSWTFVAQGLGLNVSNFVSNAGGGAYSGTGPYKGIVLLPSSGNFVSGSDFQILGQYA